MTIPTAPSRAQPIADSGATSFSESPVFVARQPIFTAENRLAGYELLYRASGTENRAAGASSETMGAHVLTHGVLSIGLDALVEGKPAWLNFTREMLLGRAYELLDPRAVVVELLESVAPDDAVIAECRRLVAAGYTLALDDFVHADATAPLLEHASWVKIDVLGKAPVDIAAAIAGLRGGRARLLAERVETDDVQSTCRGLGFELFQGYFYSRPEIVAGRDMPAGQLSMLRLLNLLRDADASDAQVESAFRSDMALSYKLLRMVNSAAIAGRGIESIAHAVRLAGRQHLHRWLSLIFVATMKGRTGTEGEVVRTAVQRARVLELLAPATNPPLRAESAFLVGLFSLLDALLRMPMPEILARVDLAAEVRSALLERTGALAAPLALVESYERGAWLESASHARALGVSMSELPKRYREALAWTREMLEAS